MLLKINYVKKNYLLFIKKFLKLEENNEESKPIEKSDEITKAKVVLID